MPAAIQDAEDRFYEGRTHGQALRAERTALMIGWSDLVSRGDFEEIERRSMRRREIDEELARLGA